ncbi:hypothetical protein [Escherichia phage vB_EcoS_IME542]|uniref:Calcineurin-like phosphoesterase domain-containing protein n=1 Tax=Escherichia phage vB_EcoS_IME542 TaxID=2507711 RepID=A0A410T5Z4_9CAUD|nr:DNA repair exonuclease [Escherichia phage vB_EcoS_IME542]QAU04384.1 hypothetical protein [Escherichia phage vB_EcoS_IME542]
MATAKITNEQLREELASGMTNKAIAEKYGMNIRNVELRRSKLAKAGDGHGRDVSNLIPQGYAVKGVSSLIGADGEIKQQWVKSDIDKEKQEEMMFQAIEALTDELPREKPRALRVGLWEDTLSLYPVFDMHIGAMAHHAECGENYSTEIAERVLNDYFDYAVAKAPCSKKAVLLIGGDFLHSDGLEAVTPTSHHVLDQDSRYHKLVYVAVRATRRAISRMLDKHKEVEVQIIPGNHDLSGMIWLRAAMAAFYMDEPRVNVDASPAALHVTQFGKTLLGYCHGHELRKPDTRLSTLARDHRKAFGESEYVYTHSGHYHHQTITEGNLGIDESHGQLGAKDAYSANGGYRSYRQASVIIYSPKFGEIGRFTCRPEMFS